MCSADAPRASPQAARAAARALRASAATARASCARPRAASAAALAVCAALLAAGCEREPPTELDAATAAPAAAESQLEAAASGASARISAAAVAAAAAITPDAIRADVAELADDRYAGRAPGSAGDELARRYLERELESIGFAPAGEGGSWEQPVELVGISAAVPAEWRFERGGEAVALERDRDFVVTSGVQTPRAEVAQAELVFVGYGIQAPEYGWDDFKGADLRGKVLVMLNNDPDWDPALFAGAERLFYGRWVYKYESAARQGAAGAIIVHTTPSAGYPWQTVQTSWGGEQFKLPPGDEPHVQIEAWVTEDAARRLLGARLDALIQQAKRRDFAPVPLGISTSLTLENRLARTTTANVLGVLRGADPEVEDELVIYSAHHDHLGVGKPNPERDPDDEIYNGARDNASGIGMVLAIGRAYAALAERPRRSIVLMFPAAEEQGLLGSQLFAARPIAPPGRIAANVNYDSGNIWGATRDITFIGLGRSTLDAIATEVAAFEHRTLKPDPFPDRGSYYRSDQFNFAKIGVPAFYLSGGTDFIGKPADWGVEQVNAYVERDYHQPSDELTDEWSFDGLVEDARFGFYAGLVVANDDELPQWNAGNEFEARRRAAIAAAAGEPATTAPAPER